MPTQMVPVPVSLLLDKRIPLSAKLIGMAVLMHGPGPVPPALLEAGSGLSRPTVRRGLALLRAAGWAAERAAGAEAGPPPAPLHVVGDGPLRPRGAEAAPDPEDPGADGGGAAGPAGSESPGGSFTASFRRRRASITRPASSPTAGSSPSRGLIPRRYGARFWSWPRQGGSRSRRQPSSRPSDLLSATLKRTAAKPRWPRRGGAWRKLPSSVRR